VKPIVDPEGVEVSHFISACQPAGMKILEIGCGHGSLTFQYAHKTNITVAIDPALSELRLANGNQPISNRPIPFPCAKGEALPFPTQFFDCALFASSL
jgi:ubiquinone/menaquinone biosynthesis C-methylase UbiE